MLNKNNKLNDKSLSKVSGGYSPEANKALDYAREIIEIKKEIGDGFPTNEQQIQLDRRGSALRRLNYASLVKTENMDAESTRIIEEAIQTLRDFAC